jgi:hypothetical protein
MNPQFRFTIGSELQYEDLVGDLHYDDRIVCILTQEHGFESMLVELHAPPDGGTWNFPLADFEAALGALKARMWELRRKDSGEIDSDPITR